MMLSAVPRGFWLEIILQTVPASAPRGTFWVLHVLHFVVPFTQSNMTEVEKAGVISLSNRRVENPWRPGWAPNFSGNALLRAT